jgi:hypothetical protein
MQKTKRKIFQGDKKCKVMMDVLEPGKFKEQKTHYDLKLE